MGSSEEKVVAVIMVGGPTKGFLFSFSQIKKIHETGIFNGTGLIFCLLYYSWLSCVNVCTGTEFRPVSFNNPKPLFPLAGHPMIHHPISACKRVMP